MRKMKKKSFDWYGARQRFSIRKYHVGAVSVFLGMSLVLGAGAQIAHAEGSIDTSETPTSVSATEGTSSSEQLPTESLLVSETEEETVIDGQTVSSQDRIATLNYIVQYVLEDGALVTASVRTVAINTTLEVARTTIPVYLEIPEGYELAPGQSESVNQEIVENGQNIVTVKVAKKADTSLAASAVVEETTVTSEVTSTEIAIPVATTSYKSDETTELVESAVSTPTTVEEAKVVLEQVLSEAELLISEAERLVAMDSANHELKTVAVATKLSVSNAGLVLNNSVAKLDVVNNQINSVRSNVEALVLELGKFSTNGDIVVLLASTASTTGNLTAGQLNQGPDSDFPVVTTSGQGAYKDGRTSAEEVDIPAGASVSRPVFVETAVYKNDPTEGRYTFLISNLDPYKYAENNARDLYMTVSRDLSDVTAQTVYVRIVDKGTQEVLGTTEVALGANSLPLNGRPENVNFLYVQNGQTQRVPILATVSYQKVEYAGQLLPRLEFYFGSTSYDQFKTTAVWQSNGLTQGLGATVHKLWSYTPQLSTNVTSYLVQGTDELIATYKVTGYEGDNFVSSGKRNFANYEYVSGQPESGTLGIDYKVGDQMITIQSNKNNGLTERRVKTIVSEDGDMVITLQYKKNTEEDSEYKTFFETSVLDNLTYGYVAPDTRKYAVEGFGDETAADPGRTRVYIGRVARWNLYNELNPSKAEVFYYYVQKGSVEVFYVDEIGNPIQASKLAVAHGDTGSDYSTVSLRDEKIVGNNGITYYYKQIDGVGADGVFAPTTRTDDERTVEEITAETGTVARNTVKELTYVYEKAGSVNVNYVDVNGNPLSGTDEAGKTVATKVADLVDAKAGTDYNTIEDNRPAKIITADGKTYELAPAGTHPVGTVEADHHLSTSNVTTVTGIHEATGTVASGITKEITFVYKEVTGKVIVKFKSIDGIELQGQRTDTEEGSTGRDYNTEGEGEVPPTITKEGKTYKLVPNLKNGNPTGKVTPGTTEVTYYYQLVTGDVVVNYENTDGKTIAPQKVDVNNGNIGDAYDTRDEGDKPEKIVEEGTGDVYYIKPAGTEVKIGNDLSGETGRVVEGTTQVTYIYEKAGNVKINYILDDADGTTLKDSVMDEENAKPGTAYNTTDEGDKPETITKDGKVYRLKEVKADSAAENGDTAKIVAGQTLEVTYVYTEVKSDVVVEYYDTEGNLLTGKTDTGGNVDKRVTDTTQASVGTPYNTDEDHRPATITTADETIYHYIELKEGSAQPEGTVAETTTTVQYVYAKAGSVVIRYVKEDDKGIQSELQPNVLDEDNVKPGTPYDTTDEGNKPTTITTEDGKTYTLVRNEGHDETGEVAAGETKEITYVYKEVTGKVIVNFKSIDGIELQDPRTDTEEGSTGRDYNTEEDGEVPPTITKDGKLYRLVPNEKDGNSTGKVTPGTTEVTYYYEPVLGDVIIKYTDTEGNTLKDTVIDEDDVQAGTKYDTTDEGDKPTEIVRNGDKYVLVPSKTTAVDPAGKSVEETGSVVEGTTTITYVYQKVANWIPEIPGVPENERPVIPYPFDPNNPDVPVTPTPGTVIPNVPGYTPVDPKDNTPLKPVDPEDPSKGYVPPTPETPGEDTLIPYVPVKGDVVINYVDTDGNILKSPVTDEDDVLAGTEYNTTDEGDKPTEIVRNGDKYVLVPSKTTAVDPAGKSVEETGNVVEGTTTITYVYQKVANWIPLIPNVPENKRPKTEYPFDPTEPDKEIPSIPTNPTTDQPVIPHVPGYTPVDPKDNTPLKPVDPEDPSKGYVPPTPETPGEDTLIPYVPVKGDVVINYVDTDGNILKSPVTDEDDVLAGTEYNTTDEGDKPTEIVRNGDKYVLVPSKTTAVDPAGKSVEETGNVVEGTTTITYVYQKVANWIPLIPNVPENERPKTGYPFDPTEPDKEIPSIPTNPTTDQPVIPHVPGYTPVDPKDNTPLKPVDPNDPGKGYVPPTPETPGEDTLIPYVPVKGDVVIKYVDTDGNTLKDSVTDEDDVLAGTKYDTTDEGDKPTEIVRNGDKYVLVPSKTTAVDPAGKPVEETGNVVEGTTTITYVYQKVANWIPLIPNVPENKRPKTEYPFDPTEPDKEIPSIPTNPTTDKPVIPHVPGYTPVDPKDNTPLKPVDPEDPSKGYVPPTPETPGEDTLIPYVPVKGDVVINYVDTDGNILKSPVTDEDDVLAGTKYDTTDEGDKPTEIVRNGDKYVLVPSKTTAVDPAGKSVEETGNVVEGTTTITYVYQKVANWIPLIPNVPENERPKTEYPFDPTEPDKEIPSIPTNPTTDKPVIPHVPGYTPVDPKDNTPLKPVDPEDPSKGYVPPTPETPGEDTLIPYVPVKGDVVIKYVDTDGNTLKDSVTDEDDVLAGTEYNTTDEGDKPTEIVRNGDKYVLVPSKTTAVDPTGKSVEETGSVVEGTTTITYVYQKVANWIPLIPNVPENERPKTEYPFDPTEPDKEIPSIPTNPTTDKPVIPHVPGYTPVDPKDNTPLTPVDPEDPSKGYVPPTPETPGEDTLIPYVPVKGDVVIKYVDTDGNTLKDSVTDEDDVLAGTEYNTTDEGDKPTEIVRNGDKYVLVPSKTTAVDPAGKSVEETGNVVEGTTTITYVYQKVANWIPLIPNVPENERPKTGYPFDPTEPDKEIPSIPTNPTTDKPVIPHVPGYTPVDPKDNTPLTPVDPEDPSKGYVPPTPETPGEDTLIPYVPVKGDVVIKYVDTDGNTLKDSVTDEDDVLAGTKYDTTDEGDKPTEIVRNGDKYVLVPSKTTAVDPTDKSVEETGSVVEGTTTITYVYQKVANWIPLIPNVPENERPKTGYPFDPTEPNKEIPSIPTNPTTDKPVIPHVPGYTPVDPKDNTPLKPVDPEDPSKGYVPPTPETPGEDTLIPYVPVKGDVVINYVDTDGNILKSPVTDEDDVLAGTEYNTTDEGDKPTAIVRNGDKYVLVPSKTTAVDPAGKSVEETGNVVEGTTTITYVYQKVANWIPLIPNVPENKRPKTEYPFDPTEPDKEIPSIPTNPTTDKPVIPHVPGYTPVDPKDNTPLTPVDPEDPSKGYVPPTPETPGEDTLIPYVPIKNGTVIVTYITEDGEEIKSPVTDTPSSPEGTPYDTTDNKPTIITYKGEEYELVRVEGTENGTVVEGDTKVTYVYRKKPATPPVTPEVKQGSVIVAYITEDGVEIKSPVTDTPTSPEGTPYDTTDNKPKTITYNGEEYELVRVDGTENGTVVEGDTKVTYVYRKKPATPPVTPEVKQGSVIVAYITEDGVEIKSPVTDTPTSPEGTPYDTTDNKPKTITYNGEEYELVRVEGTENGTVVEGDTKVTYVYRKVVKPTPPAPAKPSVAKPVKSEKPKLPDTGEEESTAGMLGVLLLVSSLFGVRKRRRDQQ